MTTKPPELEHVAGKTYGPSDTVVLDGKSFFLCTFDRCEVVYYGGSITHEECRFSGCRVTLGGAAWQTIQLMLQLGWKLTSPSGEDPKVHTVQ
jgi:hypothetical protein